MEWCRAGGTEDWGRITCLTGHSSIVALRQRLALGSMEESLQWPCLQCPVFCHLKRIAPHLFSSSRCHPRQPALREAFCSISFASSPCPLTTNQRLHHPRTSSRHAVPLPRIDSRLPRSDKATALVLPVDFLQARTPSRLETLDCRSRQGIHILEHLIY